MSGKVSVVIPVYNVEHYVRECIESVIRQTLKDWEIVCVDDGATDGSMKIVDEYAKKDDRIRIVHQKNAGLSSARNHGLSLAQGEYVLFLDSDDYLRDEALERLYDEAARENLDELFFSATSFYESEELEKEQGRYHNYYKRTGDYSNVMTGRELFIRMNEKRELKPSACLQMFRTDFLKKNGLDFYEGIIHEDNLFTMKCLALAQRAKMLNEELYMRRVRADSIMTQKRDFQSAFGYFVTIRELVTFAEEQRLSEDPAYFYEYKRRLCILTDVAASYVKGFRNDLPVLFNQMGPKDQCLFQLLIVNGDTVRQRIRKMESEKNQKEVDALKKSWSYRIGHSLMMIPGKIKRKFLSNRL